MAASSSAAERAPEGECSADSTSSRTCTDSWPALALRRIQLGAAATAELPITSTSWNGAGVCGTGAAAEGGGPTQAELTLDTSADLQVQHVQKHTSKTTCGHRRKDTTSTHNKKAAKLHCTQSNSTLHKHTATGQVQSNTSTGTRENTSTTITHVHRHTRGWAPTCMWS